MAPSSGSRAMALPWATPTATAPTGFATPLHPVSTNLMAGLLETPQHHQGHEVADVQAVGGRVKTAVKGDGARIDAFRQLLRVSAIGQQTAPLQFVHNIHLEEDKWPKANFQGRSFRPNKQAACKSKWVPKRLESRPR